MQVIFDGIVYLSQAEWLPAVGVATLIILFSCVCKLISILPISAIRIVFVSDGGWSKTVTVYGRDDYNKSAGIQPKIEPITNEWICDTPTADIPVLSEQIQPIPAEIQPNIVHPVLQTVVQANPAQANPAQANPAQLPQNVPEGGYVPAVIARKRGDWTMSKINFVPMSILDWGDGTDYGKVDYKNASTPVILTCVKHHHEYTQTPSSHKKHGPECPMCLAETAEQQREELERIREEEEENLREKFIATHGRFLWDYSRPFDWNGKLVSVSCINGRHSYRLTPEDHIAATKCGKCKNKDAILKSWMRIQFCHQYGEITDGIEMATVINKNSGKPFRYDYKFGNYLIIVDLPTELGKLENPKNMYLRSTEFARMTTAISAGYHVIRVARTVIGENSGWQGNFMSVISDISAAECRRPHYVNKDCYSSFRAAYTAAHPPLPVAPLAAQSTTDDALAAILGLVSA